MLFSSSVSGKVIYVDDDATTGVNDGTCWINAYIYLQDALTDAETSEKPVEIRVAQGIYRPDQGRGFRFTFQLLNGVTIKGGFSGVTDSIPDNRDIEVNETILSGSSDPFSGIQHIVTGSGTDQTSVLDGVIIANGYGMNCAGMYNYLGNPTLISCTFRDNISENDGAGMCNHDSNPSITDCTFINNSVKIRNGGGMLNIDSDPIITNCSFIENSAGGGGGIYNDLQSNPTLINCIFKNNSAGRGGGLGGYNSSITINDCVFIDNYAERGGGLAFHSSNCVLSGCTFNSNSAKLGGGILNEWNSTMILLSCIFSNNTSSYGGGIMNYIESSVELTNCFLTGNSAISRGGGMTNENNCNAIILNSIFTGNSAFYGGGMDNYSSSPIITNCTFSGNVANDGGGIVNYESNPILTNCILWKDEPQEIHTIVPQSDIVATYSNIQGDWPGEGNIDMDPLFVELGYWADANDPNLIVEPNDPNAMWITGDYHLKSEEGHYDFMSNTWIMDEMTSPCIDRGNPVSFVGDEPDPNGGRINLGAYGSTLEASMSPEQLPFVLGKAYDPDPANGATVKTEVMLSWSSGENAVSHDIYFGKYVNARTDSNPPIMEYKGFQALSNESYNLSSLEEGTKYSWRINEVDDQGNKRIGDVWTFTTEASGGRRPPRGG